MHSIVHDQQRYQVFEWFEWIIIDLPYLNSIKLGEDALHGSGSSTSLTMESDIDMNELIYRSSESKIHHFYLG